MKSPFSPERRKVALTVTLILMATVGLLYAGVVAKVFTSGLLTQSSSDQNDVFLEHPVVSPLSAAESSTEPIETVSSHAGLIVDDGGMGYETMSGEEIFTSVCIMCHGPEGNTTPIPFTRVPTLNNPDFLAVASDDFLRQAIAKGRGSMPPMEGLIKDTGLDSVVEHIRSWEAEGAEPSKIMATYGKVLAGREYYRSLCASCHGMNGEGGVGVTLNTPAVLGQVTDHYLADAIINGRPGTAMASWKHLNAQTLNDLLAYLRSWQGDVPVPTEDAPMRVVDTRYTTKDAKGNNVYSEQTPRALHVGKTQFERYCMECHGVEGKPDMSNPDRFAPTLNHKEFLATVSDGFLLATIASGRSHTPMRSFGVDTPGNKALGAQSMRDIVSYIRSWEQE